MSTLHFLLKLKGRENRMMELIIVAVLLGLCAIWFSNMNMTKSPVPIGHGMVFRNVTCADLRRRRRQRTHVTKGDLATIARNNNIPAIPGSVVLDSEEERQLPATHKKIGLGYVLIPIFPDCALRAKVVRMSRTKKRVLVSLDNRRGLRKFRYRPVAEVRHY